MGCGRQPCSDWHDPLVPSLAIVLFHPCQQGFPLSAFVFAVTQVEMTANSVSYVCPMQIQIPCMQVTSAFIARFWTTKYPAGFKPTSSTWRCKNFAARLSISPFGICIFIANRTCKEEARTHWNWKDISMFAFLPTYRELQSLSSFPTLPISSAS